MEDILAVLAIGAAALFASTLAAVAGFGGAAVMLPVLVWRFGITDAVPILTIAQFMGNLSRVWFNRTELSFQVVKWFGFGVVPSVIVGGIIFATAPAAALVRVLGLFLLLMVVYRHTPWGRDTKIGLRGFLPLGVTSGAISAVVGVVGPFMAPFFLAHGLVRGAYIGTEALATVMMHVTKLTVYGGFNLMDLNIGLVGVAIGSVMFAGSYLGKQILNRMPAARFPIVIDVVLVAAGSLFLIGGER
jgi:uncharacterized membrane protein YfcA